MILWLKMTIIQKFGTQRAFAKAINKDDNWVSEVVLGRKQLNDEEKICLIKSLDLDETDQLLLKS